ncbi:hypothetical protein SDC9_127731 [bioreactor metagenome]|uniref:Uncharacterized protein n=1 Tax=bioreactor metagenome TaxID=1076179 RepID=A0A645CUV8_9ZZZZ
MLANNSLHQRHGQVNKRNFVRNLNKRNCQPVGQTNCFGRYIAKEPRFNRQTCGTYLAKVGDQTRQRRNIITNRVPGCDNKQILFKPGLNIRNLHRVDIADFMIQPGASSQKLAAGHCAYLQSIRYCNRQI